MERLICKACGSESMVPVEIDEEAEQQARPLSGEQESRFFTCHVCGDNWLSVKNTNAGGDCRITFVHQMGMQPTLKRIAHMSTPIVLSESTVEGWNYFLGDDEVEETEWRDQLDHRRWLLRSICSN